jgi:aryl-alcohol dehydrogenase-like predicted oxidoreductase
MTASSGSGVDAIDLYQIHWPIPRRGHRGGMGGARRAQRAGPRAPHRRLQLRRRAAARIQQIAPVETLQPQYSLIERDVEREILPFAEREGSA